MFQTNLSKIFFYVKSVFHLPWGVITLHVDYLAPQTQYYTKLIFLLVVKIINSHVFPFYNVRIFFKGNIISIITQLTYV